MGERAVESFQKEGLQMNVEDALTRLWAAVKGFSWPFLAVVAVTGALAWLTLDWFPRKFPQPGPDSPQQAAYIKEYVGFIQVVAVGVFLTLVSALIPAVVSDARDRFERYKESRRAYSRAKTAIIYLPDKVLASENHESALQLVEAAHRQLHFAETFQQDMIEKGYLNWFGNPRLWILYNYWQIAAVATVVRQIDWNSPERKERLRDQLQKSLEPVHDRFGRRGEHCIRQEWKIVKEDREIAVLSRFGEEDDLERSIGRSLAEKQLGVTSSTSDMQADGRAEETPRQPESLRAEYEQVNENFRALADIRFRLVALVPTVGGVAAFLVTKLAEQRPDYPLVLGLAVLGLFATLGVTFYDQRNSQLYNALSARAKALEQALKLTDGQFSARPGRSRRFLFVQVGHDTALALIYSPVIGAWFLPIVMCVSTLLGSTAEEARTRGLFAAGLVTIICLEEFLRLDGTWRRLFGRTSGPARPNRGHAFAKRI
jgi:hypothetical protein